MLDEYRSLLDEERVDGLADLTLVGDVLAHVIGSPAERDATLGRLGRLGRLARHERHVVAGLPADAVPASRAVPQPR